MTYETLMCEKSANVSIITINRQAANNAVNAQLIHELAGVCADIDRDDEIKAVIITGGGGESFCTGIEVGDLSAPVSIDGRTRLSSVVTPVAGLANPVIAAVNGDALGQGLELALACDLRIAADTARFALPHVTYGVIPWDGGTQRLPRIVGRAKAMEMILTGQSLDAAEAYRIGLVGKVVPQRDLDRTARDMAQAIASKASLALKHAKEAINEGLDLTLEQGLRLEADLYFLLQTTEDRTEGIRAFLEKRPPQFKGK